MEAGIKTSYFSILSNFLLAGIKFIAGFFGNSYALIADGIESTTDIFASLLVLFGLKYAKRPKDENHPYGHGKIEPLITFAVVVILVVSAVGIAYTSILKIQTTHDLPEFWTIYVLIAIILWKEISYRIVMRTGKAMNSTSLKADAWHHRSDAITSIMALIGIVIARIGGKGYETADDWAALIAAFIILYNSYRIFRPALSEIMDEHVYDHLIEEIRNVAVQVEGIYDTEKCYVRKVGMRYHVDLHATVNAEISVREGHRISHALKDELKKRIENLDDVLIHIEPHDL